MWEPTRAKPLWTADVSHMIIGVFICIDGRCSVLCVALILVDRTIQEFAMGMLIFFAVADRHRNVYRDAPTLFSLHVNPSFAASQLRLYFRFGDYGDNSTSCWMEYNEACHRHVYRCIMIGYRKSQETRREKNNATTSNILCWCNERNVCSIYGLLPTLDRHYDTVSVINMKNIHYLRKTSLSTRLDRELQRDGGVSARGIGLEYYYS